MLSAFKMANSFYITTLDDKGHKHHYRLNAQEVADSDPLNWKGETLTRMDYPGFKLGDMIDPTTATILRAFAANR